MAEMFMIAETPTHSYLKSVLFVLSNVTANSTFGLGNSWCENPANSARRNSLFRRGKCTRDQWYIH